MTSWCGGRTVATNASLRTPFWKVTSGTPVRKTRFACTAANTSCVLTVRHASSGRKSSVSDAAIWAVKEPRAPSTCKPSRRIAPTCAERPIKVTFCPARLSSAPSAPPMAPAPMIAIRVMVPSLKSGGRGRKYIPARCATRVAASAASGNDSVDILSGSASRLKAAASAPRLRFSGMLRQSKGMNMDQRIIELYDEYTHAPLKRRGFIQRLTALPGSSAGAMAVLPLLESNYAFAATVAPDDARIEASHIAYPGASGPIRAYLARPKGTAKQIGRAHV